MQEIKIPTSKLIEKAFYVDMDLPFSFKEREYLLPIYDNNDKIIVLYFARQSEKSVLEFSRVINQYGERVQIKDLNVGDKVATLNTDGVTIGTSRVIWKSRRYKKDCLRLNTKLNYSIEVAGTHPIRQWNRWTEAKALAVGDRIATARFIETNHEENNIPDDVIKFIGYMIADGSIIKAISFTQRIDSLVLKDFRDICSNMGFVYRERYRNSDVLMLHFVTKSPAAELLRKYGIYGKSSFNHALPACLMRLDLRQTKILIESLWSCDGYVKKCEGEETDYKISYCSVSKGLLEQMQALLWKFKIASRIRKFKPTLYKGTGKYAYSLYVRTRESQNIFHETFKIIGKESCFVCAQSRDNRDTFPIEINEDIYELERTRVKPRSHKPLYKNGLRKTLEYPLSKVKFRKYLKHFRTAGGYDQALVDKLDIHSDTDLFWDKIESVEDIGEQWCYDIEVEGTNNFLVDGVVTHNSTTLANKILLNSITNRRFRSLYVTSADAQAKEFSVDKLQPKLKYSPTINRHFWGSQPEADNVFSKELKNGSRILIRSMFKSADRIRGISADLLAVDELQDINPDFLAVAEECLSHSNYKLRMYAGTPDTALDALDQVWSFSDKTEFVFKCPKGHWNRQDHAMVARITKAGILCKTCGEVLDRRTGEWVVMNKQGRYKGYRTSQMMVPWITVDELIDKRERYSSKRFFNEVAALPYDAIGAPINEGHLRKCCDEGFKMIKDGVYPKIDRNVHVFMGSDWGSGSASYTVISFWAHIGGKWTLLRAKKYTGVESDPALQMNLILSEMDRINPIRVGSDWGFGFLNNAQLKLHYKKGEVCEIFSSSGASPITRDSLSGRFVINRSYMMSRVFNMILEERVRFPCWEDFAQFAPDILSIRADDPDEKPGQRQIKYVRVAPDDFFHSMMYALIMGEIHTGKLLIDAI